jgi:hypothetical protein
MLVVVGTTHDRLTPPNTRMFLLLPWFMSFAALGLNWVWEGLRRLSRWPWLAPAVLALVITAIFGLNLYQAYGLSRTRSLGTPSLEMEFLRLVERDADMGHSGDQTYLFITDKSWGIDGLIELQRVYHAPDAEGQITRYVYAGEDNLPSEIQAQVQRKGTQVIVEPWMSTTMQSQLAILLHKLQKQDCAIQDAPLQRVVFTLYLSPDDMNFCPKGGRWEIHP